MTSAVEVALAYLDALHHDDPDRVVGHVAEDFVNEHQSEIGDGCTGREQYRQRLSGFMTSFPGRRYTIVDAVGGTGRAGVQIAVVRYRFGAEVDGHRIDIPGIMWFEVANGLITRRVDTWDSLTFLRQTQQEPPDS
jgi:ketosteroid isomerase-like protein